jgi:hypothetical protein
MRRWFWVVMLVVLAGLASASGAQGATLLCNPKCEAEAFAVDPSVGGVEHPAQPGYTSGEAFLALRHNGTATADAVLPTTGSLVVYARTGFSCDGSWSHAVISVDGSPVFSFDVSSRPYHVFRASPALVAGQHTVGITFDNASGDCRVLRVDFLKFIPYRAFPASSIWNIPASAKGSPTSNNPYASHFTSYSSGIELTNLDGKWNKPIYFAKCSDPMRQGTDVNGWVGGDIHYDGRPMPVPAGVQAATQSDGHLTVVTCDRATAFDMWRCKQSNGAPCNEQNVLASGYRAEALAMWDNNGSGVPSDTSNNSSARGSGTPILPTTVRADEALAGINHALGITVPSVDSDYITPPATHSDGHCGCGVKYGQLYVLDKNYPETGSIGRINIIRALKIYGAYIVDQGSSMEIDTDNTHPDIWQLAGVSGSTLSDIGPDKFRLVQ